MSVVATADIGKSQPQPTVENFMGGTLVTIPRNISATQHGGINGGLTKEELAKMLGVGLRTIECEMSLLKELDLVEHIGSNKTGYWRVKQD